VTLTTSYAVGDVFGTRHSLHRSWRDARVFHASFAAVISLSVAIALIPGAPLGMVTTAVQAMAGVLLPSATIFLLLLSNDEAVLGPWTNPRWLNALATLIVGVLLVLSGLLIVATLLPGVDVGALALWLAAVLGVVLAGLAVFTLGRRRPPKQRYGTPWEQATWTMPPLESLSVPLLTPWRKLGLAVLRVYLSIALILLVVETLRRAMHG
jgi:hypothetical protein